MERTAHPAHNQEGRKDVFDETPSQSQPLGGNYPSLERVVMLSLLEIMDSVKVIASHPEELDPSPSASPALQGGVSEGVVL